MLTILHGNDIVASRKYFIELKTNAASQISFQGSVLTITDIAQVLEGGELFASKLTLFIEGLLSQGKKNGNAESLIAYLVDNHDKGNIILWEEKEVTAATLKRFKIATVKMFRIPPLVFSFLDNIIPGNGPKAVSLLNQTAQTTEIELVFYLIVRHFRLLLASFYDGDLIIDEIKRLAPWQKSKLKKQSAGFTRESLLENYNKLYTIEVGQKTGTLSLPLKSSIDFFLLDL